MLDGRQRRGSSGEGAGIQEAGGPTWDGRWDDGSMIFPLPVAPTSDMPGITQNLCGRTWPRWGWLWIPTRRCPSVRERYCQGSLLALAPSPPPYLASFRISTYPLPPSCPSWICDFVTANWASLRWFWLRGPLGPPC